MTIYSEQRGSPAPDDHHFSPFKTHSSPSSLASIAILVASEEATPGSVIRYAERARPSNRSGSQCVFCSGEPKRSITSILPVSGAEQLKTSEAWGDQPISSAR